MSAKTAASAMQESRESIASCTGQGAPAGAPPVNIWSVVPDRGLLLVSDRDAGLYVP